MATWNTDKPALTNQISVDIPDIEENLQELHDVIEAITNGTLGTTTAADFVVDKITDASVSDEAVGQHIPGLVIRPKFTWKDANEIYISPGIYHHHGTTEQLVYWDAQLTYQFANLAVSDFSYLYLDDSAIVTAGTNVITASELIDSTTEPAWSEAKHGWYNGEDRCICAVLTDGSSNILEFFHDGDLVVYADQIAELALTDIDTTWTDVNLASSVPKFTTKAVATFRTNYTDGNAEISWRINGQTGTSGHFVCRSTTNNRQPANTINIITDASQIIEVVHSSSNANTIAIWANGWYFPYGM